MGPQDTSNELQEALRRRFKELPLVVQDAITSADVEKQLRALADTNQLHLDQWEIFQNEVMLALLGFQKVEDLELNIVQHVGISSDIAHNLAQNVNASIFEPIRAQLEHGLEHPDAQATTMTGTEVARVQILKAEHAENPASVATPPVATRPPVQPATPPAPIPEVKIIKPSNSSEYRPGEASSQRKTIADDPYREPLS
jgi:hypothetical protein